VKGIGLHQRVGGVAGVQKDLDTGPANQHLTTGCKRFRFGEVGADGGKVRRAAADDTHHFRQAVGVA
jgi:hypothetical protein